jgi:hypothetical protein
LANAVKRKIHLNSKGIKKRIATLQLPQVLQVLGICVFALLSGLNMIVPLFTKSSEEETLRKQILISNETSSLHESLGKLYLATNGLAAKREYSLAEEYFQGATRSATPLTIYNLFLIKRQQLQSETSYWETMSRTYSGFLFADLKLAEINLRLGHTGEGRKYLGIAKQINPFDSRVKLLENAWMLH